MVKILDWSFEEVMRLSFIKRWAIIEMSREQSVAEHSYNVAMISMMISKNMDLSVEKKNFMVKWALFHDLPELLTGDIPTPAKNYIDLDKLDREKFGKYYNIKGFMEDTFPQRIVKAADYIDAIQFAKKFCVDSRKDEVILDIEENMWNFLNLKGNERIRESVERNFDV